MENIFTSIKECIQNSSIEKYSNIVYQIRNDNLKEKEELKSFFVQGDSTKYHTVVEIDFTNTPLPRRRRRQPRMEEVMYIDEGKILIKIYNSPIYIYGRYIKMSRNMCQTPLSIGGKFKTDRNVSDFCTHFEKFYGGTSKFMGCGREDIDVRCLEGRPFIIEITNPTMNLERDELNVNLYEDVDILDCSVVTRECKDLVNCSEPDKFYNLLIFSNEKIKFDLHSDILISQKTPLRVLHRRPNLTREKMIQVLNSEEYFDEGYYYDVNIKASSGAYIKEWVNGDFGRTVPNLNSDLLELDVVRVELKIPDEFIIRRLKLIK